jgi:hypothetical protein
LLKLCDDDEVYDRQYYEKKNIINPDIRRQWILFPVNRTGSAGSFRVLNLGRCQCYTCDYCLMWHILIVSNYRYNCSTYSTKLLIHWV